MTFVLLLTALLLQEGVQVRTNAITIRIAGEPSPDLRRGIEFGVSEMAQPAKLMRRQVIVATDSSANPTAILVVSSGAPIPTGETVARIHLGPLPSGAEACEFSVAPPDPKKEATVVVWDPSLAKYGASELNERFARKYAGGMTEAAYLGWVAVKAVVEAELRRKPTEEYCRALAGLRFDGHKGRPLFFEPVTRSLSQPLYMVQGGKVIGEAK